LNNIYALDQYTTISIL